MALRQIKPAHQHWRWNAYGKRFELSQKLVDISYYLNYKREQKIGQFFSSKFP